MADKFYSAGLNFECVGCGVCCKLPGGRVELTIAEAESIARDLGLSFNQMVDAFAEVKNGKLELRDNTEGHCIFLVNDRCRVYEARPLQCRAFPFWPEALKSHYRWRQLKLFCPGIDEGKFHSAEAIDVLRKKQKNLDRKRRRENEERLNKNNDSNQE